MQKASLVETYEPFLGRTPVEAFITGGTVERYFDEHWQDATIAAADGAILGVAVLLGTLVDLIWVRPESRSQGIGSALMEAIERKAAHEGGVLTLEVWDVNRRAVAFYERRGFSVSASFADSHSGLEKLVMGKVLPRPARPA